MKNLKQDVFDTILKIAENISGTPVPKHVNFNTRVRETYYDLYLDSLDEIEIIMKLEKHYGIIIPDNDLPRYTDVTFGELCDRVCSYINQQKTPKRSISLFQKIKQHFQLSK